MPTNEEFLFGKCHLGSFNTQSRKTNITMDILANRISTALRLEEEIHYDDTVEIASIAKHRQSQRRIGTSLDRAKSRTSIQDSFVTLSWRGIARRATSPPSYHDSDDKFNGEKEEHDRRRETEPANNNDSSLSSLDSLNLFDEIKVLNMVHRDRVKEIKRRASEAADNNGSSSSIEFSKEWSEESVKFEISSRRVRFSDPSINNIESMPRLNSSFARSA